MEQQLVKKIEKNLTIEEVNKTPEIENAEVLTIETPKIEKVNKPKKEQKKTKEKTKDALGTRSPVKYPTTISITETEFLKAMKKIKVGERIGIRNLYNSYNKKAKIFNGHEPKKVMTKIRAFGKTLVKKGIITMTKEKRGFVYKLSK